MTDSFREVFQYHTFTALRNKYAHHIIVQAVSYCTHWWVIVYLWYLQRSIHQCIYHIELAMLYSILVGRYLRSISHAWCVVLPSNCLLIINTSRWYYIKKHPCRLYLTTDFLLFYHSVISVTPFCKTVLYWTLVVTYSMNVVSAMWCKTPGKELWKISLHY